MPSLHRDGRSPDIVHAHVFSAGFIALLLARGRYPVVVSEHHTDFIDGKVRGRDALAAHLVFRYADMVCPVSTRLRRHLEALEPAGLYEVVPNVVDIETFTARAQRRWRRDGTTRLLVVAALSPQKGIEYLLDALAEVHRTHPDFTLEVVGDGPGRRELEQRAHDRLPSGVVTFHGSRSRAEVAEFMARADVFVLPTIVETFGVAVIEAVAAGLPVITTSAVPDHERLEGRFGIIVAPHDTAALRDAVLRMLKEGWTVPADAAIELTRSFSAAAVSRRWDEIYRALVTAP
jgi:glycosyltransferase involved in cell wall biosynthesis